ncbi:hypothetical protein KCU64_g41, partial [Aureobasidium melanogenum]
MTPRIDSTQETSAREPPCTVKTATTYFYATPTPYNPLLLATLSHRLLWLLMLRMIVLLLTMLALIMIVRCSQDILTLLGRSYLLERLSMRESGMKTLRGMVMIRSSRRRRRSEPPKSKHGAILLVGLLSILTSFLSYLSRTLLNASSCLVVPLLEGCFSCRGVACRSRSEDRRQLRKVQASRKTDESGFSQAQHKDMVTCTEWRRVDGVIRKKKEVSLHFICIFQHSYVVSESPRTRNRQHRIPLLSPTSTHHH